MNKTQFIRELQRELGKDVTSRQAEHALNAVLDTIARSVRRRSLVKFRGFGTFRVKRRRARIVRHPENGGRLLVHESKTMKFRPSSLLWKRGGISWFSIHAGFPSVEGVGKPFGSSCHFAIDFSVRGGP